MAPALTVPHAVAALVLGAAGLAKLRAPRAAAAAVSMAPVWIRVFAVAELALGGWGLLAPEAINSALTGAVYLGFGLLTLVLWRNRSSGSSA